MAAICDAFEAYGWRRVQAALRQQGWLVNHKKVRRLMRRHGLAGRFRARTVRTTVGGEHGYVIPDLVGRRFEPGEPDRAWCQDITYIAPVKAGCS